MGSASLPELGFIPKNPSPGQRRRSVSDAVLAVSLTECFFTTHTPCRQSWRGHRIATLNPGVGTGLPHSILVWAQDCHTQSWRGHRIAPLNPGVGTGLPHSILAWAQDCPGVSQKTLEAPPGLRGKLRQRVGTQRRTPGLAARLARKTPSASCYIADGLAARLPGFKFGK